MHKSSRFPRDEPFCGWKKITSCIFGDYLCYIFYSFFLLCVFYTYYPFLKNYFGYFCFLFSHFACGLFCSLSTYYRIFCNHLNYLSFLNYFFILIPSISSHFCVAFKIRKEEDKDPLKPLKKTVAK